MRCNMCDRYVPISSSAQWERAIGRATRSALPCVARTFSFEETTRAGAAGTLQEARGARGRGSGAHTRRQSSDWLDHEHERACVDARLLLLLCLPLISLARSCLLLLRRSMRACQLPLTGRRVVRTRPGRRTRRQAIAARVSVGGIGWIFRFRRIGLDFRSCAIFSVLSVSTDSGAHTRSYPTLARHWLADRDAAQYWSARRNFPWRAARGWLALLLFRPCSVAAAPHRIARALPSSSPLPPC